jgi:hypothetical protein
LLRVFRPYSSHNISFNISQSYWLTVGDVLNSRELNVLTSMRSKGANRRGEWQIPHIPLRIHVVRVQSSVSSARTKSIESSSSHDNNDTRTDCLVLALTVKTPMLSPHPLPTLAEAFASHNDVVAVVTLSRPPWSLETNTTGTTKVKAFPPKKNV